MGEYSSVSVASPPPDSDLYEAVLDLAATGMALVDVNGALLRANQAFAALHGYALHELNECALSDFVAPKGGKEVMARLQDVAPNGPDSFETWQVHKEGFLFAAFMEVAYVQGRDGQAPCFVVQVRDIRAHRAALRPRYELLEEVQRIGQVGSFGYDYKRGVVRCSREMLRIYGLQLNRPVLKLQELRALIAARDLAVLDAAFLSAIEQRQPSLAFDYPIRAGDGAERMLRHRSEIEYGMDGLPSLLVGTVQDITERKRAQQHLALLSFALKHIQEAAFLIDEQGRFRYVNAEACRSLGYSRRELSQLTVADIDPDWTLEQVLVGWQEVKASGSLNFESRHREKNGRIFPVEITVVYFAYQGQGYNLALVRDITVRKRLETERLESERRYREVFDNTLDSLFLVEVCKDGRFRNIEVNPAFEKAVGIPRAELVGRYIDEAVPESNAQAVIAKYRRCVEVGAVMDEEVALDLPVGRRIFYSTLVPVRDETGRIHRIVGITRDITERKYAEEVEHAREQEFRTFVENAPDIIGRYDRHCRRTYLNPALEKISGVSTAELMHHTPLGKPMGSGRYARLHQAQIQQVFEEGRRTEAELSWETSEGRLLQYHVRYMPEFGRDGQVANVWAIGRDIDALKDAEQRLQESYDRLRKLAARKETAREEERKHMAREIHDELGQILTVLRMDVSLLRLKFCKENTALSKHVQGMLERVDQTIQLVRNVTSQLRPTALDMGVVAALEWLACEFAARTGIPCQLHAMNGEIVLDEVRSVAVFRIVQESLTNIVRHAEASQVDIMLVQNGPTCCLEVRDNGKGFDPAHVKKQSFGLLGMRERVLMLGGEVEFFSVPGKGTMIRVHFPLEREAVRAP